MKQYIYISLFFLLSHTSCYKEHVVFDSDPSETLELELILKLNHNDCAFDFNSKTLRYTIDISLIKEFEVYVEFQEYSEVFFNNLLLENNCTNNFGEIVLNQNYPLIIITNGIEHEFQLQFTNLPIIQIITHNHIVDEPKTLGRIIINYPSITKNKFTSLIGLEYRGETSQSRPKKSLSFCFLNSVIMTDKVSKSIFNLPQNSEWWLDAMFIDKSRLRNKSAFDIWSQIEGARNHGISSYFTELYINSEHQGIYCINELINAELLNISSSEAVLYKAIDWGGPGFEFHSDDMSTNKYWDGWEQKFPNPSDIINWSPLLQLRDLVINQTDAVFLKDAEEIININNFIDYYILLNLTSSIDNVAKNNYLSTLSINDPIFIMPWDMDGSFGLMWNGDYLNHTNILSNNLFDRLLNLNASQFKSKLKDRWEDLRKQHLSNQNLLNIFDINFNLIKKSNIIDIENSKWNTNVNLEEEHLYINNWLINRLNFLDEYYLNL